MFDLFFKVVDDGALVSFLEDVGDDRFGGLSAPGGSVFEVVAGSLPDDVGTVAGRGALR